MSFVTPELLTCLGIVFALGLSTNGSSIASSVSGVYITRYYNRSAAVVEASSTITTTTTSSKNDMWLYFTNFVKPFIPIIISGVLAIYGLIIAVLLGFKFQSFVTSSSTPPDLMTGYKYLAAGLSVGWACNSSGYGLQNYLNDYVMLYAPPYAVSTAGNNNNNNNIIIRKNAMTGTNNMNDDNTTESASLVEPLLTNTQHKDNIETGISTFPEPTIHFCMTLVYLEAIGLYGFIVALLLISL
jgi:F0F1-type ATP synthase membrane subunit c/vacuolar-type H+-ATPase subunit K